eukprot:2881457-Prymnesium_polylepis.1
MASASGVPCVLDECFARSLSLPSLPTQGFSTAFPPELSLKTPILAQHQQDRRELVHTSCNNACNFASDNDCDDGGPGNQYSYCELGHDCIDCGPRGPTSSPSPSPPPAPPPAPPP